MYRDPPPTCAICGRSTDPSQSDVTEAGLRCRRCTDKAQLAAIAPVLAEVEEAQAEHRARARAEEEARLRGERGCSRHEKWDTHCFWCVFGGRDED
jgi:hypothetical protein